MHRGRRVLVVPVETRAGDEVVVDGNVLVVTDAAEDTIVVVDADGESERRYEVVREGE